MKDNFDMFLQCMNFRMVPGIFWPKPVLKALEKSAIFIALMVINVILLLGGASRSITICMSGLSMYFCFYCCCFCFCCLTIDVILLLGGERVHWSLRRRVHLQDDLHTNLSGKNKPDRGTMRPVFQRCVLCLNDVSCLCLNDASWLCLNNASWLCRKMRPDCV